MMGGTQVAARVNRIYISGEKEERNCRNSAVRTLLFSCEQSDDHIRRGPDEADD